MRLSTDDFVENPAKFFQREPEPELYFTQIPVHKDREYVIKLFDFGNPVQQSVNGNNVYWVWKAEIVKGFSELNLDHSLKYWIHFPARSFMIAYELVAGHRKIKPAELMDCIITFKRVTKKKLTIVDRKYLATDVRR